MPQARPGILTFRGDGDPFGLPGRSNNFTGPSLITRRKHASSVKHLSISVNSTTDGGRGGRCVVSADAQDAGLRPVSRQSTVNFTRWESQLCAADIWVTERHTHRVPRSIPG